MTVQIAIGTEHVFQRGGVSRTFKRVPDGWSDGVFRDDGWMAANGWVYVRPA